MPFNWQVCLFSLLVGWVMLCSWKKNCQNINKISPQVGCNFVIVWVKIIYPLVLVIGIKHYSHKIQVHFHLHLEEILIQLP